MYFKNELKYSKGSNHMTDDVMSIVFGNEKTCQVEHYFLCRVKRQLSTALGLVSRLFSLMFIAPLNFKFQA